MDRPVTGYFNGRFTSFPRTLSTRPAHLQSRERPWYHPPVMVHSVLLPVVVRASREQSPQAFSAGSDPLSVRLRTTADRARLHNHWTMR